MSKLTQYNNFCFGLFVGLGVTLLSCLVVWAVMLVTHIPVVTHISWFGFAFLPLVVILRQVAKGAQSPKTCKALVTVLFVLFVLFMWVLMSHPAQTPGFLQ